MSEFRTEQVIDLQREGILLVEDGNHGEYRPRPDEFVDQGVAFIRAANINDGQVLFNSASKISEIARERITKGIGAPGDVLLSHKGTVGKLALVPEDAPPFVCSPQTTFWRTLNSDVLDRRYLYSFMRSPLFRAQLGTRASETDMAPYVSLTSQRALTVAIPPIGYQRTIAHILGTLDDKIELNRRMNETLEAMAQAIFKSWFVDFDPVRAKMNSEPPESICRRLGLTPELLDLFPDRLQDSELGEIPEGWQLRIVQEEFDLKMGQSPPGETYNNLGQGLPFYQGRTDFGFRFPTQRIFCTAPVRIANEGDTLISVRAPVGDVNVAAEVCCIGRGVAAACHKSGSRSYTYYFMQTLQDVFKRFDAEGTVFGSISKKDFHNIQRIMPPVQIVKFFDYYVEPIDQKIANNEWESRNLIAIRNSILPKLLSGELRALALGEA